MNSQDDWFKDWFGQDYLKVYPHRNDEEAAAQIDFVERILPLQTNEKTLDLGCGNGRHALKLARRGFQMIGLDLSPVLLAMAGNTCKKTTCAARFVRADMRYLPFHRAFDSVVSFFTTFGYFETDEENLKTLNSIHRALKPKGRFLQDYLNKNFVLDNLVPRDARSDNDFEIIQERRYNREQERIEKKITLRDKDGKRVYFESVRLYTLGEMTALLRRANLTLNKTFGDFDGRPFDAGSPRLILVGQKEHA